MIQYETDPDTFVCTLRSARLVAGVKGINARVEADRKRAAPVVVIIGIPLIFEYCTRVIQRCLVETSTHLLICPFMMCQQVKPLCQIVRGEGRSTCDQ